MIRVNCPGRETADAISRAVISAKLAPCTNLHGPVTSTYVWDGDIARDEEWVLWIKTRLSAFDAVAALVRTLHPHDVPALLALPVVRANADYTDWVVDNTSN